MSTFKDFHASPDASEGDRTMYAVLGAENGITFMAADTPQRVENRPGMSLKMSLFSDETMPAKIGSSHLFSQISTHAALKSKMKPLT